MHATPPTLKEQVITACRSRFTITPLPPATGNAHGNTLRRTLLSSIPGAAVTAVHIHGVTHEFTTIPDMREDVVDLIENIRQLNLTSDHDEPVTLSLEVTGRPATAKDLRVPAGVGVHDPEFLLATLGKRGWLEMELRLERGRGYIPARTVGTGADYWWISVDAVYSPVKRVTYKTETTASGPHHSFDTLTIDVETRPVIQPRDAMASAANTLAGLFSLLNPDPSQAVQPLPAAELLELPVQELALPQRAFKCLKSQRHQHDRPAHRLLPCSPADLLDIRNLGARTVRTIEEQLLPLSLSLNGSVTERWPMAAEEEAGIDLYAVEQS